MNVYIGVLAGRTQKLAVLLMFVFIYVCIHGCMYVCMYTEMTWMYACMARYLYVNAQCMYIHTYIHN